MTYYHRLLSLTLIIQLFSYSAVANQENLTLNDKDYFERQGLNVLVFSNWYDGFFSDSKMSGVEIIHHGVRTATNGDVRLNATPEQWDLIPEFIERKIDQKNATIEAFLKYSQFNFNFSIRAQAIKDKIILSVHIPKPLPKELIGKAGLNFEFLPASYFEKAFLIDGKAGTFPIYPSGPKEQNNKVQAKPLGQGKSLVLAPGDSERQVSIHSKKNTLHLYDGRSKAQNGWFVVRSLIPEGKSGKVIEWSLSATTIDNWIRPPVIAHSQVGYHPKQEKIATIELDKNSKKNNTKAYLYQILENGKKVIKKKATPKEWGQYKRYKYLSFNFSSVKKEGLYILEYQGVKTAPFIIAQDVYKKVWHPTLDVYFPVQMDHVLVNESYRVWHGASHLDDALQAPINHKHFDLYAQGAKTDTQYKPGEHIPGLNIGGWYDAGDYDIRTQTQYHTVNNLVRVWENFTLTRDNTSVDYAQKYVDLHVPDGKPDILQQIEHGTLALIAQYRALGRAIPGIIVPDISQYTHLGDGLTMTDNLIYDPTMTDLESNGIKSGKFDDRWAFTSKSTALNYGSIAALAAASRALKGYNDVLSKECLDTAKKAWNQEHSHEPYVFKHGNTTGGSLKGEKLKAATELLITTGEKKYANTIKELMPEIEKHFPSNAVLAVQALPFMDKAYAKKIKALTVKRKEELEDLSKQNPFGVLITERGWAGNAAVIGIAMSNYYLHKAFPDIIGKEQVFKGLNYLYGHHPDSDISFVSNVGTRSKKVAYGMNRADYSFISGGIVPGVLILKPDFPENKEDWPFLWGENEYIVNLGASYIFLANAVQELLTSKQ